MAAARDERLGGASRPRQPGLVPPDEAAVPVKHGLWGYEERSPAVPRHEAGEQGDQSPVGPAEPGPPDLAAEHRQLVAQDEYLGVLREGAPPVARDEPEQSARGTRGPRASSMVERVGLVKSDMGVIGPYTMQPTSPATNSSTSERPPSLSFSDQTRTCSAGSIAAMAACRKPPVQLWDGIWDNPQPREKHDAGGAPTSTQRSAGQSYCLQEGHTATSPTIQPISPNMH
jgi:hypothetical protein